MQYLLCLSIAMYETPFGRYLWICKSGSLSCQCSRSIGLIGPWTPPAKNAKTGRFLGDGPLRIPRVVPSGSRISGIDTSFEGLNPSDVFALHRARIEFLKRCGTALDNSGPYITQNGTLQNENSTNKHNKKSSVFKSSLTQS